ncbi:TldD/PmbA family protein [soil metagenome]
MLDLNSLKSEFSTASGVYRVYSEIRYQENRKLLLVLNNGELETNLTDTTRGVSSRSFTGGYWGFSSYSNPSKDSALSSLRESTRNAKFLAGRSEKNAATIAFSQMGKFEKSYASAKSPMSTAIWLEFLKFLDAMIARKYPDLKSRQLLLQALDIEKHLVTSDGQEIHTMVPRAHFTVSMTKGTKHGPVHFQDTRGGLGQLQDHFLVNPETLESWIDEIYQMTTRKAEGIAPTAGSRDVILAPDLAAIIMHEAIGHATEADLVLAGSVAADQIERMIGSPLISFTDFAHTYAGAPCPQPVHVDDEGIQAENTTIIQGGVLKSYMNNRETAMHFEQKPTGHARAFTHADEPLIRMRNTVVHPGQSKVDDMISSIEDGYYLMKAGKGQADTTGEFMFAVGTGFEIKNGKLGRVLRDTSISGLAFDMLKSVSMVGNEFKWDTSGYYCTKKQPMPVGVGSPAIKCRVRVGGN